MAYEKKSIRAIIDDVNCRRIYLPAIQRKYVWGDSQITKLMDSIMLGYPIGTFLFWKVRKTIVNQKEYSMYEFIKDYHDRDMYKNPAAPQPFPIGSGDETLWAVLDGQQRLTSLYIALQESMSRKLPNKRWKNDDPFPKKELYFDLHSEKTDDDDISYEFKFLTKSEASKNKDDRLWYPVKDILKYSVEDLLTEVIIPNGWATDKIATKNISLLHTRLVIDEIINYFEVEKNSIDSVLDIFVRVNSGGTVLSKSDLLFSTIVSHWDKALKERTLNVNHQLQRTQTMEYVIEDTKTNVGTRILHMTGDVYECFKKILENRRKSKVESMIGGRMGFLYLDKNGRPMVYMH